MLDQSQENPLRGSGSEGGTMNPGFLFNVSIFPFVEASI